MFGFYGKYRERKENKKRLSYIENVNNFAFFLTFLCVRKYIDNDLSKVDKFKARRMLNLIPFKYEKPFYEFIDNDFFNKAVILTNYINKKEMIYNLEYTFNEFINEHEGFFTEKEIIKLNYIFKQLESNPKFRILKVFKCKTKNLPKLTIEYYNNNFADITQKKIQRYRKITKPINFIISIVIVILAFELFL